MYYQERISTCINGIRRALYHINKLIQVASIIDKTEMEKFRTIRSKLEYLFEDLHNVIYVFESSKDPDNIVELLLDELSDIEHYLEYVNTTINTSG